MGRRRIALAISLLVAATTGGGATGAQAALGGRLATVETDGARIHATVRSAAVRGHTVHRLALPDRGEVREIARADGTIFAVTWRGAAKPDLRQLLGDRFATMQAAPVIRRGVRLRGPLVIRTGALVLRSVRRPGGFVGYAYAPDLVPADFGPDDLS